MSQHSSAPVVVIAPDSFKGSLSAEQVANAIAAGVARARPGAVVRRCPMADGGEGTLDALLAHGGTRRTLRVPGASLAPRDAAVGLIDARTAIVETAEIVGITDPAGMSVPVAARSTRGLGDAIRALLDEGVRTFYVALGGSSTNDAGAGLLAGLGLRAFDAHGREIEPTPERLAHVASIDAAELDTRLAEASFVAMSDVDNPLTGEHGATAVFGPQKGVTPAQVAPLDAALDHFATLVEAALGRRPTGTAARRARDLPGAGAAGGLGFALHVLGARFEPGAEVVAQQIGLDAALAGANWMITGEGRSDAQTLHGKAPFVACRHARAAGVPATLLSGAIDAAALPQLSDHFDGCFSPAPGPITLDIALRDAARLLENEAEQLTRLRYGRA
ncbi:glycerate kinase [Burkholderia oklahomensis]|uniref:glycerate kinase n=1 Tax=Burkholderia oklahomensis TaxID=342113 RepID=UPI00016A89C9|nr:glycerate kinase [Burkholderia oklahomensis]AJX32067.1 glycerate kinase family protein [Burkholderia oklahomensis C6786]AOI45720.1 glycerate kinase [Burkholderia oklahomensis C6786]KUY51166.1 glycerate kinase [Burkholderia oklahomensis C6786]MBI0361748.1 glycerate kinase [Burkholderia oklahomensis]SUW56023.1 Glycerate kinase [Burkholderia oklahomensis]